MNSVATGHKRKHAVKIKTQHVYDTDTAHLYSMFVNEAELIAKHEALGARNVSVKSSKQRGDGVIVVVTRELPAEVPGVLKRFIQPWNHVTQTESWRKASDDTYHADLTIEIDNVPVTISGTLNLKPQTSGCVNDIRLEVACGIPLVGGKLADFIGKDSQRLIAAEYRYLKQALE